MCVFYKLNPTFMSLMGRVWVQKTYKKFEFSCVAHSQSVPLPVSLDISSHHTASNSFLSFPAHRCCYRCSCCCSCCCICFCFLVCVWIVSCVLPWIDQGLSLWIGQRERKVYVRETDVCNPQTNAFSWPISAHVLSPHSSVVGWVWIPSLPLKVGGQLPMHNSLIKSLFVPLSVLLCVVLPSECIGAQVVC